MLWVHTGRCRLVVLSPIHDSARRAAIGEGEMGYFDIRLDHQSDGASYSDDVANNAGISIERADVSGALSLDGTSLTIIDPIAHSEAMLVEVLIHEVQHDADLELRPDVATVIAALDLTVTLISAERLRVGDAERGVAHVDRVVVRFERGGEAPVEVVFGRGQRVHRLYGVGFAVFGGTVLSVSPPGVHVMP